MSTTSNTMKPGPIGTAILDQLSAIDARDLSPETARTILDLGFDDAHHQRVTSLSTGAAQGSLTPAEHEELDEYIRVADLLAILQSKARHALKLSERSP
jgi:hypothetical protein